MNTYYIYIYTKIYNQHMRNTMICCIIPWLKKSVILHHSPQGLRFQLLDLGTWRIETAMKMMINDD